MPLVNKKSTASVVYTGLHASWEQPHMEHQASESGVM